jgi:hypothetical protein
LGNRDGFNKSDPVNGVVSAIGQTNIESNLTASLIDLGGANTYPCSSYSYILLKTLTNEFCEERREFMKYLNFVIKSDATTTATFRKGFLNF